MSKQSRHVWRVAIKNARYPPCPDNMSEPRYAALLFDNGYCTVRTRGLQLRPQKTKRSYSCRNVVALRQTRRCSVPESACVVPAVVLGELNNLSCFFSELEDETIVSARADFCSAMLASTQLVDLPGIMCSSQWSHSNQVRQLSIVQLIS